MALTETSNKFKYEKGLGNVDFSSHTFTVMLMQPSFSFTASAHGTVADLSSDEISSNGSYARATLVVHTAWYQDDAGGRGLIVWEDVDFTASGGNYDDFGSVIIYDNSHADDVVVGWINLEATLSVPDGLTYTLENIYYESV